MATPAWKTGLQQASFRGVPFAVSDADMGFGRRNFVHEYPLRDVDYGEDLGRKAREYSFNAFVIGDNYFAARDALIDAIENDKTPGVLVHPTLGIKTVIPQQCRVMFKNTEGGIEYFSLSFIEAGANKYPTAVSNTVVASTQTAAASTSVAQDTFSSHFNVVGLPDSAAKRAAVVINSQAASISGVLIPANSSFTGLLSNIISQYVVSTANQPQLTAQQSTISNLKNNTNSLVNTPIALASNIASAIAGLNSIFSDTPAQALAALTQLFNLFGLGLPTTTITAQQFNQQMIIDLIEMTALIQMIAAISNITFTSRTDALNTSSQVVALMNPKLTYLADNGFTESFMALGNAKVAMVNDIKARAGTLKNIIYVQVQQSIPALVFAYMKYGDSNQVSDVLTRNSVIQNPGFVPANTDLEVLQ